MEIPKRGEVWLADLGNVQGMLAVPSAKFLRRLGALPGSQMVQIEAMMKQWLGLEI
jgi:hypothetical protein